MTFKLDDKVKDMSNKELDDALGNFSNFVTGAGLGKMFRKDIAGMADAIKIYKEANAIKDQAKTEKRRIQEKQIRMLRSNYRPGSGLLGDGGQYQSGSLGSATGLPNKLGTA